MTFEEFAREWENAETHVIARSSGSTGTPKRIPLLKERMRASAWRTLRFLFGSEVHPLNAKSEDYPKNTDTQDSPIKSMDSRLRFHSCVAADYIGGKMMWVRAREIGANFSSEHPSNRIMTGIPPKDHIDLLAIVPSQLKGLLERMETEGVDRLPTVSHILVGGAPLSTDLRRRSIAAGLTVWETYGMTETCSHIAIRSAADPSDTSPFRALPGVSVSLDERECLTISVDGETFRTNDMARLTGDSGFLILGRYDNVIISGGLKIHPEEGERLLAPLLLESGVTEFALTSLPDPLWGEKLIIAAVLPAYTHNSLFPEQFEKMKKAWKLSLPRQYIPKELRILPNLPRLESGKLNRRALKTLLHEAKMVLRK